jgi:hypothetical protein
MREVVATPKFDAPVIDGWLGRYPARYERRVSTLDQLGLEIRNRRPVSLRAAELRAIADWKSGGRSRRHLPEDNLLVERVTREAFQLQGDASIVGALTSGALPGVRVGVASAVLRFIWPDRYGCVDWRNWYVLSVTRSALGDVNELFADPLLKPLSSPYSSPEITPSLYAEYLKVIRKLAADHPERTDRAARLPFIRPLVMRFPERTPAEIDLALYAYSQDFAKKLVRRKAKRT